MKIQKLNENMPNLDKVVHNDDLNAVTEMPPTMSDAYIDSVEADKAVEDIIKPAEEIIKEKPFLGAYKQPTPKEPEEAKITLDESLFEDANNQSIEIYDFLDECGGYTDYNQKIEDVMEEFDLDRDTAESYVWDWASGLHALEVEEEDPAWHDTADQEEEEDIPEDILRDYIDSIEVEEDEEFDESLKRNLKEEFDDSIWNRLPAEVKSRLNEAWNSQKSNDWFDPYLTGLIDCGIIDEETKEIILKSNVEDGYDDSYEFISPKNKNTFTTATADWSDETDVEFDESLNEEDKSKLSWDELGTEEAEDVDLWTLIYDTLSKERDLGAKKAIKRYVTPDLSLKQRYDPINADSDGNIVVYGETEEEFNPAKEVADFHNLKYKIKESPKNWVMRHPEQKYSFTIIIPEDQLNRKLELRRPDVKRGRPKKN